MYSFGNIIFFAITLVSPISLDAGNVCTDGTGFTQCGAPPLTAEQIANIDTDRVNELRNTMMNLPNGRGPLVENHPDISPNLLQPIVNFTDEQLAVYESKYPRRNCEGATCLARKKRSAGSAVCNGNGFQTVLFALTISGGVVEFRSVDLYLTLGCTPTISGVCNECCEEEICLPLFCYSISPPGWGTFDIILKRCTCCTS
ncbi:uncharacterized protein [Apostichopus japonicus]|uniref:uncharacterized protein isoform X2 n=1 Tax=Stichopus japonicus TaxID=307972 RepID=UPI003AB7033E